MQVFRNISLNTVHVYSRTLAAAHSCILFAYLKFCFLNKLNYKLCGGELLISMLLKLCTEQAWQHNIKITYLH